MPPRRSTSAIPNLTIETAKHRRDRPQARARRLPLRRQGLLHALSTTSSTSSRPASTAARSSRPAASGPSCCRPSIAQRDAIFRGAELAWQWDVVPVGPGVFGVDGQYDTVRATFTDGSNVPRIPPQRLGGGAYWRSDNWFVRAGLLHAWAQYDLAPVRDADRRLQSGQGGDRQQAVLARLAVGTGRAHDRSRRQQPAQRRYPQQHAVPQGRGAAARTQREALPERQVRRRSGRAARPAT